MSGSVNRARRNALAIIGWALFGPITASAQDPRAALVQRVAREWLALVDRLDAAASWKAASGRFQASITAERWAAGLKAERGRRGAIVQRAVTATTFATALPGLPEGGNYARVEFRTSFANESAATERVTLEVGPDYAWHVVGYLIR